MYNYAHTDMYVCIHTRVHIYKICKKLYIPKSGDIENYYYERNGNHFSPNK